jgi:hypothetical protein
MDSYRRIAALKIQSAQDRASAIVQEICRVENRVYASPGSKHLLGFVKDAAIKLQGLLEAERKIADTEPLSASELETRLHRTTKLIPYLHMLLGFVEGSDVNRAPGQLIQPLRRYVRSIIPDSEIFVSSKAELNYSIQDIAGPVRKLFSDTLSDTPLHSSCELLPQLLFVVNIPAVEAGEILIHGLLAHELGHPLYKRHGLAGKLLPNIKVKDELVRNLVKMLSEAPKGQQNPTPELRLREWVTEQVTSRTTGWVVELSCDAIGLRLFGPAMFFAAVHLMIAFKHLDEGSKTHPPSRLRIKLMIRMLKQLYSVDKWHDKLQAFMRDWDAISADAIAPRSMFDQLAIESIDDKVLDLIAETSSMAVPDTQSYTTKQFEEDSAELTRLLINYIPPGERGSYGRAVPVALASIINAGWHVFLCDFETFREGLHSGDSGARSAAKTKLHELILKALEISEMKTAWDEASLDSQRGKN